MSETTFTIRSLDHVAIRVKDMEASAQWYEDVLGLQRYEFEAWGPYPIFMLAGQTGVAIFPVKTSNPKELGTEDFLKIDHFAFNVDKENFAKAQQRYRELGISFQFQDHTYYHSIYTKDPDGHTVELTTLVVEAEGFFRHS